MGRFDVQRAIQLISAQIGRVKAEALRPIAGRFAFTIFALGIIGAGLLAVPVLAGSAAYAVGEALRWEGGTGPAPRQGASARRHDRVSNFSRTLGNHASLSGLPGGAEGIQTDGHRDLTPSGRGMLHNLSDGRLAVRSFPCLKLVDQPTGGGS
jgi:hypothetical protein